MIQLQKRTIQVANADMSSTYNEERKVAFSELLPVKVFMEANTYYNLWRIKTTMAQQTNSEILLPKVNSSILKKSIPGEVFKQDIREQKRNHLHLPREYLVLYINQYTLCVASTSLLIISTHAATVY